MPGVAIIKRILLVFLALLPVGVVADDTKHWCHVDDAACIVADDAAAAGLPVLQPNGDARVVIIRLWSGIAISDEMDVTEVFFEGNDGYFITGKTQDEEKWAFSQKHPLSKTNFPTADIDNFLKDGKQDYGCPGVKDGSGLLIEIVGKGSYKAVAANNIGACTSGSNKTIWQILDFVDHAMNKSR